MLKSLLPNQVKVDITDGDIRLWSKITTNKTKKVTSNSLFYTILGFTQSHSSPLNDPAKGYVQKTSGSNESQKEINNTAIDKFLQKCDCNNGSIVKGI